MIKTLQRISAGLFLLTALLLSTAETSAQSLYIANGVNYVEVGDLDVSGSQITVEAIVTKTGNGVNIVSKHTDPTNVNYLMRPGSAEITTTNGYINAVTGFPLVNGVCYHLAFTYDGTSLNYYVNGCLASSTPHSGDLITNDYAAAIGDMSDCECESWIGYIDEVRIWNVARTQAQIQANMTDLPNPATQPGLLAYYKFDGDFTNAQGNATWDGTPIGNPQLQTNTACQNVDLSFQNQVTVTDVSCNGAADGTVTITSSGGHPNYTYSIDGVNFVTQNSIGGLPPGNGFVWARSGANSGCLEQIPISISEPPAITTSITGTDPVCAGANDGAVDLTVNGGVPPYTYSWSSGSTVQDPNDLPAGTHTVTITDASQCTVTETITLTDPPAVLPNAYANYVSSQGACDGGGVANPNGGTPPYTYLWDNGQITQVATGMCTGQHSVTVTDANGCTGFQYITVNVPACLTDVDFNTWQQAGQPANGNWTVQNGGAQVFQSINGNPTFFVTPVDYINVRMKGRMRTTDNDDDYMGVVFGFKEPLGASDNYDMWLFDWKQANQTGGGFVGQEGMSLCHVVGTIPSGNSSIAQTFFGHQNTSDFTVVASNFGPGTGWNQNVDYLVEVTYTVNRAIILVDGDTIFDVYDCFEPGRFGFYNYSQQSVTYSDFTYELFADFTVEETQVCALDTAHFTFLEQCGNFTNLNQFDELHWDFGDGSTLTVDNLNLSNVNPEHVYQSGGNYVVRLVALDTLGCRDTVYKSIEVFDLPTAEFTFSDQCFLDQTQFTDASVPADHPIAGYAWLIEGNQIIQQNTSYQFAAPGQYLVGLGVQDTFGCLDTVTHVVQIHVLPQADFVPVDDCYSENYPFVDQSTITNGSVTSWEWDFGDATTSTLQHPTHSYPSFGQYDVTLVALSDQGCADTVTQTIILHDVPVPGFEVPNICQLQPIQLNDTASIQEGAVVSWNYDLGDGSTSTDQHPSHIYQDAGLMNITQTVTSDVGCDSSITVQVTVHPKPQADFSAPSVCLNNVMAFTDQSSVVSGAIVDWQYDLGDGNIDSIADPSNLYASSGTYNVTLMVTTDQGCRDTTTQQVEVYQLPVADFNFANVCSDVEATFTDQSVANSGSLSTWTWNLGDGSVETVQGPVTHLYPAPDDYDVQLIVQTDLGCSDTLEQTITIHPIPEADFIADSVCFGFATQFTDQSTILSGSIDNYTWDFGFSSGSSVQHPTFVFPQTGYHPVLLTVTSDLGCKDTVVKDIRVYVLPEPAFAHNDTCFEDNVNFINLSTISEGTLDAFFWNFGDQSTSTLTEPTHGYGAAGLYQVVLTATSNFGCQDSTAEQVEVYPLPQLAFDVLPAQGCQPLQVAFDNNSVIDNGYFIANYFWDLGNGVLSTQSNPQVVYADSGRYDVRLIATTTDGCDDTLLVTDAVEVWPRPVARFSTDKEEYLMYFPTVQFTDESTGATLWDWDFDDGSAAYEQHPEHTYQQHGTYQVLLTVQNDFGCDDVASQQVIVKPAITLYVPNAFTPNNDGLNEVFKASGVVIEEFNLWIFDRWGENLFHTASMDHGWDGTYKGKQVESGMYLYRITVVDLKDQYHEYTGEVYLMR